MSDTTVTQLDDLPTDPPLGALVTANPGVARVLEQFGLDYCCGGQTRLTIACMEAGLDPDEVRNALANVAIDDEVAWADLEPVELIDHVLAVHHAYLRDELPALDQLANKVASVHGERHPELIDLAATVAELRADLLPHMAREELALFPMIRQLVAADGETTQGPTAADLDRGPIASMRIEHDQTGRLLERLRSLSSDFDVPADGCASYTSLYQRLAALEADTHLHVHKENNVLFEAVAGL
jgi:regulator of cell morphogenesis and NO signaling